MDDIDTTNDHMVAGHHAGIVILVPPTGVMPIEEALRFAAWIAVLADPGRKRFDAIREAIENS